MDSAWEQIFVLILATILATSSANGEIHQNENNVTNNNEVPTIDYRLPTTIMPMSYNILLELPRDENFTIFKGTIIIKAIVEKPTNEIVFHMGKIVLIYTRVIDTLQRSIDIQNNIYDPTTEKYKIILNSTLLAKQNITIAMKYRGILRDDMIGFYRSSYIDKNGKTKWLAATQFDSTHARDAFPCFDEPSFKATFTLRILRPKRSKCLSNMPLVGSVNISNELVWDTFGESVVMSTYLVAFIVSDFPGLQNIEGNFSVWARPNAIVQAKYALEAGPRVLQHLSILFNSTYQLDKMDMVALPDFSAGAMENWGLITYRETRMLYDENHSSVSSQQKVLSVIVHECVHMWFGNLVTPNWWGCLWLSEGFARYYEYMATAELEPSWKLEQQFVVDELQSIYGADALDSSKPMTRNVSNLADIGTAGDTIIYAKSASVIRMMELTFGSNVFNHALQEYLRTNNYSSAIPEDLWSALQHQADERELELGASVKTIMNTWTTQAGFPVLSVNIANGIARLHQERFFIRNQNSSSTKLTWWIPITWTSGQSPDFVSTSPKYWFGEENAEIEVTNDNDQWIIFNVRESGYYRVNYDVDSWNRIIGVLASENFEAIHEINRAAVVDDLLNLARASLLDYDTALRGVNYIKRETNYLPFKAAFTGLEYLLNRFAGQPDYDYVKNHSLSIIRYVYDDLGYEDRVDDDRLTILLRNRVNNWACKLDHGLCIEKSRFYFDNWRDNSKPVPKNQREAAYCSAMRYGTSADWNFLWEQYLKSECASEQMVILGALACSQNTTILEKYLLKAVTKFESSRIRKQDSTTVFNAVYASGFLGARYILDFVEKHHVPMAEYDHGYGIVDTVLSGASRYFSTEELIVKFETLMDDYSAEFITIGESLKSALKLAKYELKWYNENENDIITWMRKNNKVDPTPNAVTTTNVPISSAVVPPVDTSNTTDYRLPTSILPKSYAIEVTPYIEMGNFTFDGSVRITAGVAEATNKIVLHVDEIVLHSVVVSVGGKIIKITSISKNLKYNFLTIYISESLIVGETVMIVINYTGQLNTIMRGFYRSSYVDDSGVTRWLAATHLEPVGARKMFPCFDEPALKATFVVSVRRPTIYNAISNTPLKTSVPDGNGRFLDTFEETPIMSTHLVAIVVSDFKSLVDEKNNCSIWARPNAIEQGQYALSVMGPLVKFYETSFEHFYQLPKLDMIALPDFASGAMENWGLLTYRETNMLYDPANSPITSKQAIANVISHEISHQWLGDQVSPRWWKYVWLSEGFARYFQFYGTANVEPKWGLESQFVVEQLQSAFQIDSRASTHPMTHDVYSPAEISGIFDTVSYAKSASVLRMIEKAFGTDLFYKALHDYLEARKYNDATPDHLIEAFQKQIDSSGTKLETTIKTIMDSWTRQAGYPVVNVVIYEKFATLEQKRFYLKNYEDTASNDVWWIPVTWASKSSPDFSKTSPKYWMNERNVTVNLNVTDEWIIFNLQESGYYRVNYDRASWNRIINALRSIDYANIHEVNRASLIDDLLILGQAGQLDYSTVLSATQYLTNETNYIPWRAAFNGLAYLNRQFKDKDIYELYRTHILTILNPIYEKLGFNEETTESHYDKLLRRYVVNWACSFNVKSCVSSTLQYFAAWKSNNSIPVPVNLRSTIYCTAIKYGSTDDWEFLWKKYFSTSVTTEKNVMLSALGCSNDTAALEKLLTSAITKNSGIRFQDSMSAFTAVYSSGSFGAEYTLDFVDRNYTNLYEYYGEYNSIASILNEVSSVFKTKKLVLKFENFVKTHRENLGSIESSMKEYLNDANEELNWYDRYSPRIFEWLEQTYPNDEYRLSTKIYPTSYDIYLTVHLEDVPAFTFDGETTISMNVNQDTSSIVLHANELTIKEIIVYVDSVNSYLYSSYTINSMTHRFTIYLKTTIHAGSELSVYISYAGVINDEMIGFYRSSYVDKNGKTRLLASTQFEPVYARQAFPCFDEPALKAKFTIHIERPNEYRTRSNMPWIISNPSTTPNRTWDSYEQSIPMSSYLVAFVISDFESLNNDAGNFTVWGRPEAVKYGSYALDVGQRALKFLENFTAIGYPLKKMDLFAIPDFHYGAMENWGLITFREYGLLQHENVTTATYKRYLHTTVAHEIVHMWFGNLVTCEWWDYIWLHEGFAQYLQWFVSDYTRPEWNLLQQFVVYELQSAMEFDGSPRVHPMNNKVLTQKAIVNSLDKIAYGKSASVIRMMHHALGSKVFESGLRTYLERNKYKTATPDDLSLAIQFHEDMDTSLGTLNVSIKDLMDSWTNSPGYPVVNATWHSDTLTLVQERFFLTRPSHDKIAKSVNNVFWIPISVTTRTKCNFTDTRADFWFGTKSANLSLLLNNTDWFIINIQETGYYRVNYDVNSWIRLIAGLRMENFDGIHEINRAQIVDDIFNLARIDYVTYDLALSATKFLEREENHLPWKAFFNAIDFINRRFDGHKIRQDFADHVLLLVQRLYEKIGFVDNADDNQLDQLSRELILVWSCKFGHSGCIESSMKYFNDWREDEQKWISPNARPAVYCTSIKNGNYEDWQFLWDKYEKAEFSSEKLVILKALGCSRNTTTLNNYLKLAISSNDAIRDQDVGTALESVSNADSFGVDVMLDFLVNNYKDLREYYHGWTGVGILFTSVAGKMSTEGQIEKLELFANNTTSELAELTLFLRSAITTARRNFQWFQNHEKDIENWLTRTPDVTKPDDGEQTSTPEYNSSFIVKSSLGLVVAVFFLISLSRINNP